jgi:hypothetical protein
MESVDTKKTAVSKKPTAASLRVKVETRKRFLAELARANKKSFGRRVRASQLLNLLLTLLRPEHIQKLQEESLSNADRLEMMYHEHVKRHGATSKDEFLGKVLGSSAAFSEGENAALQGAQSEANAR